jgi:heparan-alpha-glucosaminide N-acetyltransferase
MAQLSKRLASVDAFRALTMFFMIFVNDLWSLKKIPDWLEHAKMFEDRMGFADTIFPAFLFIVGLSIPFAISGRLAKGYSRQSTLIHILTRSFALLLIGFFHVNLENYNKLAAILPKPFWQIGITVAFFLIWMDYAPDFPRKKKNLLKGIGIAMLVILALLYKGSPGEGPAMADQYVWMRPQWYGILGLIGWAYLYCALIYLVTKDRLGWVIAAFLFFCGLMISDKLHLLHAFDPIKEYAWINSSGALPALTMAGVLCAVIYRRMSEKGKLTPSLGVMALLGVLSLIAGFTIRPYTGGISKIMATPAWVFICIGISIECFVLLAYIMDVKGQQNWIKPLKPAGTSTLTCYLLPYIHYAFLNMFYKVSGLSLIFRTGGIGIIKSLLYAFAIIWITGWLEKRRIRLAL